MQKMYIVSVSGGAGSTVALERCIEMHGLDRTVAVFADTGSEHETLYNLIAHIQKRHPDLTFIHLGGDRDIWDVFDAQGIIRTPTGACKASLELKQKPIARWVAENCTEDDVMVSGLEYSEPERRARFDARWKPMKCWHPLADPPYLSECQIIEAVAEMGYPRQALYERRYPHNNCGGGCILAGLAQWHGLWLDDRDRFDYAKKREREFNEKHRPDGPPFTVLRDQSAKPTVQADGAISMERRVTELTLEDFETRIRANDVNLQDFRSACGCFLGEQTNMFDLIEDDGCIA